MSSSSSLDLKTFYPKEVEIRKIIETKDVIQLHLKSRTRKQCCPKCGQPSEVYHSTYSRKLQDLPILAKRTEVYLKAYRYYCHTEGCDQKVFCETIHDFFGTYKRMTGRLEDFIIALATQTSCEGAARICSKLGIKVSGDTIIRMFLKRAETIKSPQTDIVGIDDWAYKKRYTYGTIIVDGRTHQPIDLLDGRDGKALKAWLAENKQVKVITRDRANAYATAIQEVLPHAMQVADRFHLYQNLMEAIQKVMSQELPARIRIEDDADDEPSADKTTVSKSSQERILKKTRKPT
jgi:transposase